MAVKSKRGPLIKSELIAQLEAARWQMGRETRGLMDGMGERFSVRTQLQASIRRRPSIWGVGTVVLGFIITCLLFGKKKFGKDRNTFYPRRHPLARSLGLGALKLALLAAKPSATKFVLDKLLGPRKN